VHSLPERAARAVRGACPLIRALVVAARVVCADETPIRAGPGPKTRKPQVPGQQPGERSDHGPVGPVRFRTGDLAAQDRDLMPQYQDLHVLRGVVAGEQRQPAEKPAISR